MADGAGIFAIFLLLAVAASILPIPFALVLASIAVVPVLNVILWHKIPDARMPVRRALKMLVIGALVLALMGTCDVGIGYLTGSRTLVDAFMNSGPLGGTVDMFLAALGVFVGIPTLVRAAVMFHERQRI
jgi:hypothetical protein